LSSWSSGGRFHPGPVREVLRPGDVRSSTRTFGLIQRAMSADVIPVCRCSRQDRTSALIFFRASLLIAGRNEVNCTPSARCARRGRNVNPKNVNDVCSCEPRRLLSLQYTILV